MLNILIAGVGGQGNVLASRVIAECAIKEQLSVKTSETIGMAQREGVVVSHVRIGKEVSSPLVGEGQGDVLLGMELAEAARSITKLKSTAKLIVNDHAIVPAMVSLGRGSYHQKDIKEYILSNYPSTVFVPASNTATELGSIRATNVVMLGVAGELGYLRFSPEQVLKTLLEFLPEKHHKLNTVAFENGRRLAENYKSE